MQIQGAKRCRMKSFLNDYLRFSKSFFDWKSTKNMKFFVTSVAKSVSFKNSWKSNIPML